MELLSEDKLASDLKKASFVFKAASQSTDYQTYFLSIVFLIFKSNSQTSFCFKCEQKKQLEPSSDILGLIDQRDSLLMRSIEIKMSCRLNHYVRSDQINTCG